jgi:hypothetical protein
VDREVFACELVEDPLALVDVLGELLLLISDPILNCLIVDSHREVISFFGKVVEARPSLKGPKDCARGPAAISEALPVQSSQDRLAKFGRVYGSSGRSPSNQVLVLVISTALYSQLVEDTRG